MENMENQNNQINQGNQNYPKIKNAVLLCLMLIGVQVGIGLIIGIKQYLFKIPENSPIAYVFLILTSLISFGIVILIGFKNTKKGFNEVFKFNKVSPILWITATIITVGLSVVVSEVDNLIQFFMPMPEWFLEILGTLMADQPLVVSLIYIGLIAALSEELFFRGLILDGFVNNYSKRKAIIISALLFGMIHLNPWQFAAGFIVGIVLAWICIETKSILLCIYMHFLHNAGVVILYRLQDVIAIDGYTVQVPGGFQPVWFTLSGLLLLIVGIASFYYLEIKPKTADNQNG
ncbi:MAG: CPBP family intramembrane metalloprotease [Treponema sp.]|nr:CPBP family intramembrane metalloprotease [Treponema sp.]